ncbi:hypothetical protein E4T44_05695 [Aureobasidium sp. EXF-8845]|nr:hypothetical protein E4T44_05695 [Aureobasidium sp. EXF-8845]KAI4850059.1 hypothetical protein E4T45_05661 [Aureobasidium sp. EXF-8846]
MTRSSPDYAPSEMSVQGAPLPGPGSVTRRNRPALPRNAVTSREHPPLYAGDYNNNLSKNMYWWEKLDASDPEEKRILLAMYYGEERQPRCNVCERKNRACMWFLGEEDQLHKSCVKCRRTHATCKPVGSIETTGDDSRSDAEICEGTNQQPTSSHKRKASELDASDGSNMPIKRTRSSLNKTKIPLDDDSEVVYARSQDDRYVRALETPSSVQTGLVDSTLPRVNERRDDRLSSITFGADAHHLEETSGSRNSHDNTSPGFSQIEKGLYALIDERYRSELKSLRTMVKTQAADLMTLRADCTTRNQKEGVVDELQMQQMESQIETERAHRRRLEDEDIRLKNRMARLEGGQEAGMNDLQDQIRQLREEMSLR